MADTTDLKSGDLGRESSSLSSGTKSIRREIIKDWVDSPFQYWARNYVSKNQWRVGHYLGDYEDCLSECAFIYVDCYNRYAGTCETNAQFMRLYQIMVTCYFADYSNSDSKLRKILDKESQYPSYIPSVDLEELLKYRTRNSSQEVKQVINIILSSPAQTLGILTSDLKFVKNYFKRVTKKAGINNETRVLEVQDELRAAILGGL